MRIWQKFTTQYLDWWRICSAAGFLPALKLIADPGSSGPDGGCHRKYTALLYKVCGAVTAETKQHVKESNICYLHNLCKARRVGGSMQMTNESHLSDFCRSESSESEAAECDLGCNVAREIRDRWGGGRRTAGSFVADEEYRNGCGTQRGTQAFVRRERGRRWLCWRIFGVGVSKKKKKKIEEESVFRAAFRHRMVSHYCASSFGIFLIWSTEFASSCAL